MTIASRRFSWAVLGALTLGFTAWAGCPASAEGYPRIWPEREVAVTYDLQSTATGPMQLHVMASPMMQVMRIEFGGDGDYLLLDRGREKVRLVSPHKGLVFVVSSDGFLHRDLGPDSGLRFRQDGHREIAGRPCTLWTVAGPDGAGEACVTRAGVVLEGAGHGDRPNDQGQVPSGHLIATRVSDAPLSPALFVAPTGLQEVDLPLALFRAMVPGLSGLPAP